MMREFNKILMDLRNIDIQVDDKDQALILLCLMLDFFGNFIKGKLPLAPMNYQVSSICPHELPSAILDPVKLPNPSQHLSSVSQLR
jgi:hypothetical protein